jgi:hypothetical protein
VRGEPVEVQVELLALDEGGEMQAPIAEADARADEVQSSSRLRRNERSGRDGASANRSSQSIALSSRSISSGVKPEA